MEPFPLFSFAYGYIFLGRFLPLSPSSLAFDPNADSAAFGGGEIGENANPPPPPKLVEMSVGNMNVAYPTIWTKVNTNWSAVNLQTVHFEPVTMEAYQQAQQNAQGD